MTSAACYGAMDKKSGLREIITAKNLFGDLRVAKHAFWGGRVNNMKNYKIAVAGTGYVGLSIASLDAKVAYSDVDFVVIAAPTNVYSINISNVA